MTTTSSYTRAGAVCDDQVTKLTPVTIVTDITIVNICIVIERNAILFQTIGI